MAIEVVARHEYNEPKYLTKCYKCKSILRFTESDLMMTRFIILSLVLCVVISTRRGRKAIGSLKLNG